MTNSKIPFGLWLNDNECERCGGEGFVSYLDSPDVWGEDCPSMSGHYVRCPECNGSGLAAP